MSLDQYYDFIVSIHAPTKGATAVIFVCISSVVVSIHAPTKGATVLSSQAFTIEIEFQSTLPRRERL